MNESDKDSCTASSALPHPGEVPQRRRKKKSANRASSATERNHSDTFSEVGAEGVAYTAGPASAASTRKSNRTTSLDDNVTERFSRATISDERDRVKIVKSPASETSSSSSTADTFVAAEYGGTVSRGIFLSVLQ
jgi:hypothetical protein